MADEAKKDEVIVPETQESLLAKLDTLADEEYTKVGTLAVGPAEFVREAINAVRTKAAEVLPKALQKDTPATRAWIEKQVRKIAEMANMKWAHASVTVRPCGDHVHITGFDKNPDAAIKSIEEELKQQEADCREMLQKMADTSKDAGEFINRVVNSLKAAQALVEIMSDDGRSLNIETVRMANRLMKAIVDEKWPEAGLEIEEQIIAAPEEPPVLQMRPSVMLARPSKLQS